MISRRASLLGLGAAILSGGGPGARAQGRLLEYSVKAAFLTRFPAFVNWPGGDMPAAHPLHICLVGDDQVGASLAKTAASAPAGVNRIAVRRLETLGRADECRIAYVAGSALQSVAEALAVVRGAPVLTVTDAVRGADRGMIHFVVFEDRVRFHVDARAAATSGIGISSKLLALALSVKR